MLLLPVPGSALQARYSGPYTVQEKVNERDYIVATPDRKRRSRLCHINMLKPYLDRGSAPLPSVKGDKSVFALSSAESIDKAPAAGALSSAEITDTTVDSELSDVEVGDVTSPSSAVVQGRLQNSEMLSKLDECFPHLSQSQHEDVVSLIKSHVSLFSDVPTQTHVLTHDIDVEDSPPIKQHPYRANPFKRHHLQKQVNYMLKNGIAEPSCSSWSSPCLLA